MSKFSICFQELSKHAFGPEGMGKVLSRFKQIQLKSPAVNGFGGAIGGPKGIEMSLNSARRAGIPEEALAAIRPQLQEQFKHMRPGPTTFTPLKGDGISFLKSHGIDQALEGMGAAGIGGGKIHPESFGQVASNPSHRRALDAVLKGHELAEASVKPSNSFLAFGHRSPDVILREHNMIQTLPKDQAPVGELMRSMRAPGETQALAQTTGFHFGEGPRISRHARKHLTEMHEQEAIRLAKQRGML
jgi:hypothetical protein